MFVIISLIRLTISIRKKYYLRIEESVQICKTYFSNTNKVRFRFERINRKTLFEVFGFVSDFLLHLLWLVHNVWLKQNNEMR